MGARRAQHRELSRSGTLGTSRVMGPPSSFQEV